MKFNQELKNYNNVKFDIGKEVDFAKSWRYQGEGMLLTVLPRLPVIIHRLQHCS